MPHRLLDDYDQWRFTAHRLLLALAWSAAAIIVAFCVLLLIALCLLASNPAKAHGVRQVGTEAAQSLDDLDHVASCCGPDRQRPPLSMVAVVTAVKFDPAYFSVSIRLTAITGPVVMFRTAPLEWRDLDDCQRHLPAIESVVARLARLDPSVARAFGQWSSKPSASYFVSQASCEWAPPPDAQGDMP